MKVEREGGWLLSLLQRESESGSDLARSCSLAGGNPAWKDKAKSPVASLGA